MDTLADTTDANFDSADEIWEQLAEWLERFAAAWQREDAPPPIADFVPAEPLQIRRLALAELIKLDMEYRSEKGLTVQRIEQYLETFPELGASGIPVDLLYEEFHIRRSGGESVSIDEYVERFPDHRDALRQLLQLDAPALSTAMFSAAPPTDLKPGDQLDDFDLLAQLGKGAFATVFLARQRSLQRLVAVKISADRGSEPQTLARLDHPNIVRVYDQRVIPERGIRLLYMKCVPGGTLEHAIAASRHCKPEELCGRTLLAAVNEALDLRGESPPAESAARARLESADWPETVCRIGYQLAQALHYAHTTQGVLHRDLKPANILLTAEAVPQLVDFNISFCSKLDGATPAAYFGGSLAYMSPEQLQACNPTHSRSPESLTSASDIYSLGVVLWEMLSGSRPYADQQLSGSWSETLTSMVASRSEGPDVNALATATGQLRELVPILARSLTADPARRYCSADEMANDLRLCLRPAARHLLRPDPAGWIIWLRRFVMLMLAAAALGPNVPTAYFNFVYNQVNIIDQHPRAGPLFLKVQSIINSLAFPLGVVLVVLFVWPVARAVRSGFVEKETSSDRRAYLRQRSLRIGHFIALLALIEWTIAGMAYPLAMFLGGERLTAVDNVHFFGSLLLCGMVAAAYPYFFATAITVRAVYPAFIEPFHMRRSDVDDMDRLERWTWWYLALGLLVPMLAVALWVTFGGQKHRILLAVVSGSSLAGFVLLVGLARYLQNTVATMRQLTGVADKRET